MNRPPTIRLPVSVPSVQHATRKEMAVAAAVPPTCIAVSTATTSVPAICASGSALMYAMLQMK